MSTLRVAVAGGTGVVGAHVVALAHQRGHEVISLSRREGVDLTAGKGLADRLAGVTAVIDCLSTNTGSTRVATNFFTATSAALLAAGATAGVAHHLTLSIVGIEQIGFGYYRGKVAQEERVQGSGRPHTILRATQFHEFAEQMVQRMGFGPLVAVPRMSAAPIAAVEVAEALLDLAESGARNGTVEIGGPERLDVPEMVRQRLRHDGRRALVVPVPMPGGGRAARDGGLVPVDPWRTGHQTYGEWLRTR